MWMAVWPTKKAEQHICFCCAIHGQAKLVREWAALPAPNWNRWQLDHPTVIELDHVRAEWEKAWLAPLGLEGAVWCSECAIGESVVTVARKAQVNLPAWSDVDQN